MSLQVTYPLWVGSLLHCVPLLLILASLAAKARQQSRAPGPLYFSSALLDGKGPPAGGQPPLPAALPLLREVRRQQRLLCMQAGATGSLHRCACTDHLDAAPSVSCMQGIKEAFRGAGLAVLAFLSGCGLPALLGILRTLISGGQSSHCSLPGNLQCTIISCAVAAPKCP